VGQVPKKNTSSYLLIGNGRLAKHLATYFTLSGITCLTWSRSSHKSLPKLISSSQKIIVLINDDEIENFILQNRKGFEDKIWIHCSGLLSFPFAESAHPLMTFTDELYDLKFYKQIPFITEKGKIPFNVLLPELQNPSFQIEQEQKPYYHAWCVISGNFTTLLWGRFFKILEDEFEISRRYAFPYLNMIGKNLTMNDDPLTGPLIRKDKKVIRKNLTALKLKDDPFFLIYKSFVETYKKMNKSTLKK
jgi:2-dehydropantoate 2-reductase